MSINSLRASEWERKNLCAHCGKLLKVPDVFWHEWIGYIHRSCWQRMLDE